MKRSLFLFLLMLAYSNHSSAQGKLGVFVGGGAMFYSGDLQDGLGPHPATIRWTADAGLHWQITRRWGLQLNYTVGEILGDQALSVLESKRNKGLKFQSFIHEIGIRGTYDILRNDRWKILPYLTVGVGAIHWNPKRDGTALQPLATEGVNYGLWNVSFPTGLGGKYQINCKWAIKGEINYHWTLTDYLDDVSNAYPANEVPFYSDPGNVSPPGTLRGDPTFNDGFWDINIGVVFFFTGCRKGMAEMLEDCDQLNKGVDMDMLREMYK